MLQKLTLGTKDVVAFRWEGNFDKKAFDQAMDQFLPELKARDKFNIYLEIVELGEVEANAVWQDIKFYSGNFSSLVSKIDKVALVTDNSWLKNLAETSYKLVPGIELKAFPYKEQDVARHWILK